MYIATCVVMQRKHTDPEYTCKRLSDFVFCYRRNTLVLDV